jgi:hypothetical protein
LSSTDGLHYFCWENSVSILKRSFIPNEWLSSLCFQDSQRLRSSVSHFDYNVLNYRTWVFELEFVEIGYVNRIFHQSWEIWAINSLSILLTLSLSHLSFWEDHQCTPLICLMEPQRFLGLCWFYFILLYFCSQDWIISIDLPISPLIVFLFVQISCWTPLVKFPVPDFIFDYF